MKNVHYFDKTDMYFFSADGTFGTADGLVVCDTDQWTTEDWEQVEEASDSDRPQLALEIMNRYNFPRS